MLSNPEINKIKSKFAFLIFFMSSEEKYSESFLFIVLQVIDEIFLSFSEKSIGELHLARRKILSNEKDKDFFDLPDFVNFLMDRFFSWSNF